MKMSKNITVICLVVLTIAGSFLAFLSNNMFFGDIVGIGAGFGVGTNLVTFPPLALSAEVVALMLYLIRMYKRPENAKALTFTYSIIFIALSAVGFIGALLSGIVVYHSFVKPYPFPGYVIIFMIVHLILIGAAVFMLLNNKKREDDLETFKMNAKHIFKTLGWYLFISLSLNRLGSALVSPFYIQWSTFYYTFPFYISLLIPMGLCAIRGLFEFDMLPNKKLNMGLIIGFCGLYVALFVYTAIIGSSNTEFISAISQALPLERIAAKPVELPIHLASVIAVSAILLLRAIKESKAPVEA